MCVYIYIYIHTHIYIYIYTHIHTHIIWPENKVVLTWLQTMPTNSEGFKSTKTPWIKHKT